MDREYLDQIIDRINHKCPYNETNGIRTVLLEEGHSVVEVEVRPEHLNVWGLPHGGLLFAIADVASGTAAHSTRKNAHFVTADSSIHFLYANPEAKRLRAEGRVIRSGRTLCVVQAEIYDDQDHHVLTGQYTMYDAR